MKVADNSGAKFVRCFRILGGTRHRYASIGDIIVASVQSAEPRKEIKKKAVLKVLVVRTKNSTRRADGSYIRFDENAVIVIDDKKMEPIGTRIFGPLAKEALKRFDPKDAGYKKITSIAEAIL